MGDQFINLPGGGGGGGVSTITAADTSIVVGGSASAVTLRAVSLSAVTARATQVGGDITLANTGSTSAELAAATGGPGTGGLDVTITAASGDVIQLAIVAQISQSTIAGSPKQVGLDLATMVSGSVVNWVGQSAGTMAGTNNGLVCTSLPLSAAYIVADLSVATLYTVQAGDVSAGTVKFRPYYGSPGGSIVLGRSAGSGPFILSAVNLRH